MMINSVCINEGLNNKMPLLEPCDNPPSSKLDDDDQARNLNDDEIEIQRTNAMNLMKKFLSSTPNVKTAFKPRGSNIHQLSPIYEFQDLRENRIPQPEKCKEKIKKVVTDGVLHKKDYSPMEELE